MGFGAGEEYGTTCIYFMPGFGLVLFTPSWVRPCIERQDLATNPMCLGTGWVDVSLEKVKPMGKPPLSQARPTPPYSCTSPGRQLRPHGMRENPETGARTRSPIRATAMKVGRQGSGIKVKGMLLMCKVHGRSSVQGSRAPST